MIPSPSDFASQVQGKSELDGVGQKARESSVCFSRGAAVD